MAATIVKEINSDQLNKHCTIHSLMDSMLSQVEEHVHEQKHLKFEQESFQKINQPAASETNNQNTNTIKENIQERIMPDSPTDQTNSTVADTSSILKTEHLISNQSGPKSLIESDIEAKTPVSSDLNRFQKHESEPNIKLPIESKDNYNDSEALNKVSHDKNQDQLQLNNDELKAQKYEWVCMVDTQPDELVEGTVLKRIIKAGDFESKKPVAGDRLWYRIITKNDIKSELIPSESFDETCVILGDYDTISGVYLALANMYLGEIAEVLIDYSFAYGNVGRLPHVPESCRLHAEIELLKIEEVNFGQNDTFEKRFEMIRQKKDKGNFWFACDRHNLALFCYQRALEMLEIQQQELVNRDNLLDFKRKSEKDSEIILKIDEERDAINLISLELLTLRFASFNNMAATFLKLNMYSSALEAVNSALMIDVNNVKALFRKAKIYAEMNEYDNALKFLAQANKLDPKNRAVTQEIARLKNLLITQNEKDKKLYEKMMQGNNKKTKTSIKESIKNKKAELNKTTEKNNQEKIFGHYSTYVKWSLVFTGVALAGFVVYKRYHN